jgi:uncharacterized delta-60 repeat protein
VPTRAHRSGPGSGWIRRPLAALVTAVLACVPWIGSASAATSPDLDPTFGGDGEVVTAFHGDASAVDVDVVGNRILVAGTLIPVHAPARIALVQYRMDGSLDTAFGNGGRVVLGFGDRDVYASALLVQPNRRIVVAGTVLLPRPAEARDAFALARFLPAGALDTSFGAGGRVVEGFQNAHNWSLEALTRQPDGKLVVGGTRDGEGFALARFRPGGALDRSYGDSGRVVTGFPAARGGGSEFGAGVSGLTPDASGRIVAVGWTSDGCNSRWALARYRIEGRLDPTFGGDGRVVTRFSRNDAMANAVEFGDDNRMTVAGSNTFEGCGGSPPPDTGFAALARYLPDGRLDPSFGGDGKVSTAFLGSEESDPGYSDVALLEGGAVVAAGSAYDPKTGQSVLVVGEYLRNGSLNPAFSHNGRATAPTPKRNGGVGGLSLDPLERPTVAGWTYGDTGPGAFLVARFR